jgi:hypothetical protein
LQNVDTVIKYKEIPVQNKFALEVNEKLSKRYFARFSKNVSSGHSKTVFQHFHVLQSNAFVAYFFPYSFYFALAQVGVDVEQEEKEEFELGFFAFIHILMLLAFWLFSCCIIPFYFLI